MSSFNFQTTPISMYTIVGAMGIAYIPGFIKNGWMASILGARANFQPRGNWDLIDKKGCPEETKNKIKRLEAAHLNNLETLPLFSAAVIAGNYAGVDTKFMNQASVAYLVLRTLYVLIYVNQSSRFGAALRSITFVGCFGIMVSMFTKAGNALALK